MIMIFYLVIFLKYDVNDDNGNDLILMIMIVEAAPPNKKISYVWVPVTLFVLISFLAITIIII